LESHLPPRGPGATTTTTGTVDNVSTTVIVDLINETTMIADPILATMTGIDVITAVTTAATIGATTTVAMSATTNEMTDVMIVVARKTTITMTTIGRNELHRHHPKGATPMAHSKRPTAKSTSSSAVAKRSKAIDRPDQTLVRSGTSILKTHDLCVGLNSQSLSPEKIIGFTSLTPRPIRWPSTP
jgi:hypothetical protein